MFGRRYWDDQGVMFRSKTARDSANRLRVEDPEAYRAMESWGGTFRLVFKRMTTPRRTKGV